MNERQARQLCLNFGLGDLQNEPQAVTGGLLHKMWQLDTEQGQRAVTELNPNIINKPGLYDEYRRTSQIAVQMTEYGIPAVLALEYKGDVLVEIDKAVFM